MAILKGARFGQRFISATPPVFAFIMTAAFVGSALPARAEPVRVTNLVTRQSTGQPRDRSPTRI